MVSKTTSSQSGLSQIEIVVPTQAAQEEEVSILQQVDDGSFNIIAREIEETTQI